jgi:regulator of protease activity HflC (stomatin/prohibitin superfamily)
MRKVNLIFSALMFALLTLTSCTTVDSGHTGVKISWGGETDMKQVYPEGFYGGLGWMWNSMKEYETRERTLTIQDEYLDLDGLKVPIDAVIYFKVQETSVNRLHKDIGPDFVNRKISPAVNAALKTVIPQYRALELNTKYREQADNKLTQILKEKFPEFYVDCIGVNITKVDIPKEISNMIVQKQIQDERNTLAEKKELEQKNLAQAEVARAKGEYEAAQYDAKTRDILSSPKQLELYRAETERVWAEKGVSPWGNNNVFGDTKTFKGYK